MDRKCGRCGTPLNPGYMVCGSCGAEHYNGWVVIIIAIIIYFWIW